MRVALFSQALILMFQKVEGPQISSENPRTARLADCGKLRICDFRPKPFFVGYGFVICGPNFF
jgi:hypothetical protein